MAVKFSNNFSTFLSGNITASDTTITLQSVSGLPTLGAGDYTYLTIDSDTVAPTLEIVKVTAVNTGTGEITVTRAQDGTTASSFSSGAKVELRLTAVLLNDVSDEASVTNWADVQNKPDPTLTLTGDVTGTATFTDLASASLATTASADLLRVDGDGSDLLNVRAETIEVTVKNVSGGSLAKGTPVHQTGTSGSSTFEVVAANASNSALMPAHFVLLETLADQAEGRGLLMGRISGVDTSGFSEGDTIYVAAGGGYTNSAPTGEGNLIQNLGTVTRVDATSGGGEVMGAGRSAATPNLNNGNIFIGNASNQAVTASLSTSVSNAGFATTSYVDTAVANLVDSAPATLDTLNELAAALGDDPNFATTVTNSIAAKQDAATALTTSTTFGGDVSGTYNAIVVADDSHNHIIGNVDGLQTALNAKQDASTALTTSTTFGGDVSGTYNAIVVADDSHNHIIGNVDGLQTALDSKVSDTGDTITGTLEQSYGGTVWSHSEATVRPVSRITYSEAGSIGTTGTNITDVYGEADLSAIDNDATFTYAAAWDAVESHGGRLPTLAEVMDGVGQGSGQGYDSQYIWTCTPAGPHHVWVALGAYSSTSDRQIVDITNASNVYRCRAFFDVSRDGRQVTYEHDGVVRIEGNNRAFHDGYHPNADKWTTARTLSLTGAVTGSASIDGSGNVSLATTATSDPTLTLSGDATGSATFTNLGNATLTVTVADDSHNHIISNVDGLQTALDGKQAAASELTWVDQATGNYGTIKVDDDRGVTWAGYAIRDNWVFMANGDAQAGIYNDTDNEWAIKFYRNASTDLYYNASVEGSTQSGYFLANNQMRAPIFYDSGNTGYYVDAAGTSVLNNLAIGGAQIGSVNPNLTVISDSDSSPFIAKTSARDTVFAILPWTTGYTYISSGIYYDDGAWVHSSDNAYNCLFEISGVGGARWYASSDSTGSWNLASATQLWGNSGRWSNNVTAPNDVRAPIFYDSDNTAYSVNPNGTSILNNLRYNPDPGSISTAAHEGSINYVYNSAGGTPTRGDCSVHVYHVWSANLSLNLTSSTWQTGDIVRVSNAKGTQTITVSATRIYLPDGSYDTSVTFNNAVGGFVLAKYTSTTGYWMVMA